MAPDRPPRLAWGMWKRFLIASCLIVLLTAATTATAVLLKVGGLAHEIGRFTPAIRSHALTRPDVGKPQTILVLGSDRRYGQNGVHAARSDTLLLIRLNPDSDAINVMSIPRDLKVEIPRSHGLTQTDKINAAYSIGGPDLTARTIKKLFAGAGERNFQINHILNVNFHGFKEVVDAVGCVYADIDRRYYNDNAGVAPGFGYATINVPAGYQKLCGQNALDYVRFRHLDTDIVRNARQQDFLRALQEQKGAQALLGNQSKLIRIFARNVQSDHDLRTTDGLLNLLKLGLFLNGHSIHEVHFPAILGGPTDPYVTATEDGIHRTVKAFLAPVHHTAKKQSTGPRRRKKQPLNPSQLGLYADSSGTGQNQAILVGAKIGFPVFYPRYITGNSNWQNLSPYEPRVYSIRDTEGHPHGAYRLVLSLNSTLGQYWGVQGMSWKDPPILKAPHRTVKVHGRELMVFPDGSRTRMIAWKTPTAVYWISNTLTEDLKPRQMLAIAATMAKLGGK